MAEAEFPPSHYPSLSALFTRHLKPGLRQIGNASIVSPCDSRVIVCGKVVNGLIEQVKHRTYSIDQFLGSSPQEKIVREEKKQLIHEISMLYGEKAGFTESDLLRKFLPTDVRDNLYYIVLYLSPADYHRVHSPTDWTINTRRHFPGTLFPVHTVAVQLIPKLLALNERVLLAGEGENGFFSLTAVGAYNVGSIELNMEPNFRTNRLRRDFITENLKIFNNTDSLGKHFYEKQYSNPIHIHKGDDIATFNFGSTVVLIFESKSEYQFDVKVGDKVKMGQNIGHVIEEKEVKEIEHI